MVDEPAGSWAQRVFAITLVVEDLDAAREFYGRAFGLPEHYYSGDSAVFRFGDLLINLLEANKGPGLLDPVPVAPVESGVRVQLTVPVDDVDAVAAGLVARGRRAAARPGGPSVGAAHRELPRPRRSRVGDRPALRFDEGPPGGYPSRADESVGRPRWHGPSGPASSRKVRAPQGTVVGNAHPG